MNPRRRRLARLRRADRIGRARLGLPPRTLLWRGWLSKGDSATLDGPVVFITHTLAPEHVEAWVQRLARRSGQALDWGYAGGRAAVHVLGDFQAARRAIVRSRAEHDDLFRHACRRLRTDRGPTRADRRAYERSLWCVWKANQLDSSKAPA